MGGSSTPSPTYAQANPAYMSGLLGQMTLSNSLMNAAVAARPEVRGAGIDEMQTIAAREAFINAVKSAEMEKALTPEIAATRKELTTQTLQDLKEGPSKELSNLWLRNGIRDAIATGAKLDSGFARSAMADRTKSDYFTNRLLNQNKAASFLQANPQPLAGVNPGDLATASQQARADNMKARENYTAQVLAALSSNTQNASNAFQQAAQYNAAIDSANLSAYNQMKASKSGSGSLWGPILGAVGLVGGSVIGGPVGGAAGGAVGYGLGSMI